MMTIRSVLPSTWRRQSILCLITGGLRPWQTSKWLSEHKRVGSRPRRPLGFKPLSLVFRLARSTPPQSAYRPSPTAGPSVFLPPSLQVHLSVSLVFSHVGSRLSIHASRHADGGRADPNSAALISNGSGRKANNRQAPFVRPLYFNFAASGSRVSSLRNAQLGNQPSGRSAAGPRPITGIPLRVLSLPYAAVLVPRRVKSPAVFSVEGSQPHSFCAGWQSPASLALRPRTALSRSSAVVRQSESISANGSVIERTPPVSSGPRLCPASRSFADRAGGRSDQPAPAVSTSLFAARRGTMPSARRAHAIWRFAHRVNGRGEQPAPPIRSSLALAHRGSVSLAQKERESLASFAPNKIAGMSELALAWSRSRRATQPAAPREATARPLIAAPIEMAYRRTAETDVGTSRRVAPAPSPPPATPAVDLNRLTQDVWRQLDKRLRIERERRGRM